VKPIPAKHECCSCKYKWQTTNYEPNDPEYVCPKCRSLYFTWNWEEYTASRRESGA
jgi:Zn finger protein HypA/HybF involved in hydrogenase expression